MTEKSKVSIKKLNLLISIILAFAAWVYVIYNYAPMKEVYYSDVPIQFVGEDTLAYKGLGVESSSQTTVRIKAEVKRTEYANISADSFDVIADVSGAVIGDNGISLSTSVPEGVNLENISISSVNVKVEKCSSKQVNVAALYSDAIDTNSEPSVSAISYKTLTVTGAEKNLKKVKYAGVFVEMGQLSQETKQFFLEPVALDENGKKVEHILVVPNEISLSAYAGYTKEVPLKVNTTNNTTEKKTCETVETIVIKGRKKTLDKIDEIETTDINLDEAADGDIIPLTFVLPDGVDVTKAYIAASLKVHVEE